MSKRKFFFNAAQEHLIIHFVGLWLNLILFSCSQESNSEPAGWRKEKHLNWMSFLTTSFVQLHVTGDCGISSIILPWKHFDINGMCCKFTYYFAVTDRDYAFLFKSNAVGNIWSLMKIFYSSSCRRSLSVISFCSNINKKYISLRLCTLVVSLSMKLLLTLWLWCIWQHKAIS